MSPFRWLVIAFAVLVVALPTAMPAGANDHYPSYDGNAFRDLIRYGFEILPGLGDQLSQGSITGNSSIDARIWNLAYARGYRLQRPADMSRSTGTGSSRRPLRPGCS